jgi:hypothetical protein
MPARGITYLNTSEMSPLPLELQRFSVGGRVARSVPADSWSNGTPSGGRPSRVSGRAHRTGRAAPWVPPAVLEAFEQTGYKGYLTFEYFHPYLHWPEALIYQTADSLDRMLGLKG